MAAPCLRHRRVGVVLALAAVLAGLLAAPSAHAEVPTITGAVVSADPGPIVEGSVYFATTDILLGFTGFGPGGSFSFPVPADRRLEGGVTVRVSASSVMFHYGKEERITINCRFVASVFTCDPIPPVILRVASMFGNIQGTVQDGTGRPVEGAVVSAVPTDGGYVPVARTDATGAYLFPPYDFRYPEFGRGISVPEGGSHTYVVSVSLPTGGPPPNPQQVMVTGGVIAGASFGGRPPAPPENRPQETAQGPGDACSRVGKPITVTTGNMYTQQEDLAYPSAFGRFAFTRIYNSQSTYQGPQGLGWTHVFDVELRELRPGVIRVRNGVGKVRFYELLAGSSDTYRVAAPARDTSTLVKHAGGFTETERDGLRREFDPQGRLLAVVTRAGWRTLLTYTNDRLATVTDPGGRTLSFTYSTAGQLTRVDGPGGFFAQYTYDAQGRLVTVSDALGPRWTYTYSDSTPSRLTSVHDANGHLVEQHTYDTAGRVIATTEAAGVRGLILAYLDGAHTRVTDSLGRATTYTFGDFGDLPLVTQIAGPCACGSPDSTFEYDTQGRRTRQTDARGNTTSFEYDAEGNLINITDAMGHVTTFTYNAFGQVLTPTDPTGAPTTFAYDATTGFLLQVTDALGHMTTLTPDSHTLPETVTDPRGHTTSFTYDSAGLLTTVTDPTGAATRFIYDAAGRLLIATDALGGRTRYAEDQRGRLLSVTDPTGAVSRFQYDPAGNRIALTDPIGRSTTYNYDAANRLTGVTDPALGTTAYTYDTESNLLTVTDAKGQITTFAYDAHNRLARRTDPLGNPETFTYDAVGNLLTRTNRKGQMLGYNYDALNRLTEKALPDGTRVTYVYDALGRLLSATDANGALTFSYDALGRVRTTTSQDSRTLTYTYDPAGNRVGLQDETGNLTTYAYDPRNLLMAVTDPRTGAFGFKYDPLGRRTTLSRPNGTTTAYTYDLTSRLTGLTHGGPRGLFETLGYSYDPAGNRTADTLNRTAHQYTYDPLDQLTQVQRQEQRSRWKVEEAYTYDPVGNRLTGPQKDTYTYDATNRLTSDGKATYTYDANGNLVEKRSLKDGRVTTYTYDAEDRLIRVVTPKTEVTFSYDPLVRRTEKRVVRWLDEDGDRELDDDEKEGSTRVIRYLYDQEDILATFSDSGREVARYTHGSGIDEPLAEVRPHRTRFYHADTLGSVIALTEKHGHPVREYRYSAFGIPEDHRGDPQPYRYTGREWDRETGLYFYRARYYAPESGRFVREDLLSLTSVMIPQSRAAPLNSEAYRLLLQEPAFQQNYIYVENKPISNIDPSGLLAAPWHFGITFVAAFNSGKSLRPSLSLAWNAMAVDFGSQGTSPADTVQHGMASAGQSSAQAIAATNAYIQASINSGNLPGAIHAAQDLVTPGHAGQPWKGFGLNWESVTHILGDIFPSWSTINQAYQSTRGLLNQAKRCSK